MIRLIAGFMAFHSAISKTIISVQEMNSPFNLTFNRSVDTETSLEEIRSERFKD